MLDLGFFLLQPSLMVDNGCAKVDDDTMMDRMPRPFNAEIKSANRQMYGTWKVAKKTRQLRNKESPRSNQEADHGLAIMLSVSFIFSCSSCCFFLDPLGQWYWPRYVRVGYIWVTVAIFYDSEGVKIIILLILWAYKVEGPIWQN